MLIIILILTMLTTIKTDSTVVEYEEEFEEFVPPTLTEYEKACCEVKEVCKKNGFPYSQVLAICILETGWFKSYAFTEGNNFCGITIGGEVQMYSTRSRGMEALESTMLMYQTEDGFMTIDKMAKKYCPPNWEQWAKTVKEIMKGIEDESNE